MYVYLAKKLINWNIFSIKFNKYFNAVVFMYTKRKPKKAFFLLIKIQKLSWRETIVQSEFDIGLPSLLYSPLRHLSRQRLFITCPQHKYQEVEKSHNF